MKSEKILFPAGSAVGAAFVIRFDGGEVAGSRVAGVAAAAHVAGEAARAGLRDVGIAVADGEPLSRRAWADLLRACPGARAVPADVPAAVTVSGRTIVAAEALRRFLHSDAARLRWHGEVVAVKADGGSGAIDLASSEAVAAEDEAAATRWVLRRTGKASDGVVSKTLNRPLSQTLSRLLLRVDSVRPWHMTAVTAALAVLMLALLLRGSYGGLILGGILFHLVSVLDGVDGEIARATYRSSASGAALDTAVDMATNLSFYFAFTLSMTRIFGKVQAAVGAVSFAAAVAGLCLMAWLARRLGEPGSFDFLKRYYISKFPSGLPGFIIDSFIMIMSRDFFAFAWALLIVAHTPFVISFGLAFFATLWMALIVIAAPAMLRDGVPAPSGRLALGRGQP
jgi:phosphatidylglycerophosphate synthase